MKQKRDMSRSRLLVQWTPNFCCSAVPFTGGVLVVAGEISNSLVHDSQVEELINLGIHLLTNNIHYEHIYVGRASLLIQFGYLLLFNFLLDASPCSICCDSLSLSYSPDRQILHDHHLTLRTTRPHGIR